MSGNQGKGPAGCIGDAPTRCSQMNRTMLSVLALSALFAADANAGHPSAHLRTGLAPVPNATTAHLTYQGGPMIQHVKIFLVFYSPGYQYKDQLVKFYQGIVQSAYVDMLQEYDQTT